MTVDVPEVDESTVKVSFEGNKFSFAGSGGTNKHEYACTYELYDEVDPQVRLHCHLCCWFLLSLSILWFFAVVCAFLISRSPGFFSGAVATRSNGVALALHCTAFCVHVSVCMYTRTCPVACPLSSSVNYVGWTREKSS